MRTLGPVGRVTGAVAQEIDIVIDLIAAEQRRPERNVPTLATSRGDLVAELEEGEPAWTDTLRVIRHRDTDGDPGRICGAIVVDWNIDAGRAWIHGPWVEVGDDAWLDHALPLVGAGVEQLPDRVARAAICGDVRHRLLERLAGRLHWSVGEVNHALAADLERIASTVTAETTSSIHDATEEDVAVFGPLHDAEFPSTYFSAAQLVDRVGRGDQVVLVALDSTGNLQGYAAGRVQPDGDGYIDFLAVAPDSRRLGTGRALVVALARRLLGDSTTKRVCLTVRDSNATARRLYDSLGFEIDVSIATYESPSPPTATAT